MQTRRLIFVDNATLSGVERITGTSQVKNLNYIDNDILCLEKLVTAILFSDQVAGIDDYKDEYRAKRLKNFDFISFKKIDSSLYEQTSNEAANFAKIMTFSFDGSKPAGDVIDFFESLQIRPQMRWNIFVSSEYLTLAFLVEDAKYAPHETSIDAIFRNEDTDRILVSPQTDHAPEIRREGHSGIKDIKSLVQSFTTENPSCRGVDNHSTLERIIFGYGWAAERSYFYNAIAHTENADVYLAPLRDAFCESCCRIDYPNQIPSLIENLKIRSQETISSILEPSGRAKFALRLPFFTSYLISKTDNPIQCIDFALSMRNETDFQECRTIFHNLTHLTQTEKTQELNRVMQYLGQSCDKLMKKYAVSTGGGLQFSISTGITGPNIGASLKLNDLFRFYRNEPFSRIFRNIAQDMLNVERMGSLHDKVCSLVKRHNEPIYTKLRLAPQYLEDKDSPYSRPAD